MKRLFRLVLSSALLIPPRVCVGDDGPPSETEKSVAAAQGVSGALGNDLHGVIGNLTAGQISRIYGERQLGDPDASSSGAPQRGGVTANSGAGLPAAQLPIGFQREAAAPPNRREEAPTEAGQGGLWEGMTSTFGGWFSSPPAAPPAKPVENPSFSRAVPCPDGKPGCVEVMTVKENSPAGLKSVPITDFVEYGTLKYKGKQDAKIWDDRPWWKFWAEPRQVSTDDIRQGGLGDCSLLASLAAIANKEPQVLRRMIKQQQGSLAVYIQFFDGKPPKPVLVGPVDDKFAVYKPGITAGAVNIGGSAVFAAPAGAQGAIWPLLIEKAYAVEFSGKSFAQLNRGVWPDDVMTQLTGQPSHRLVIDPADSRYEPVSFQDLAGWDANSQPIAMSTKNAPEKGCPADSTDTAKSSDGAPSAMPPAQPLGYSVCTDPLYQGNKACLPGSADPVCAAKDKIVKLVTTHSYWVKKVDAAAQTVTLANPWGSSQPTITLPWTRLQKSLYYVYANEKAP
ncbi:MAG TPA: C2 family cysteine protease [Elusimicrobiota bacterium]|nr:C2 family cysteine protease [Elusimicrobiota bacterium]